MKTNIYKKAHVYCYALCLPILLALVNMAFYLFCHSSWLHWALILLTDIYLLAMLLMAAKCSYINGNIEELYEENKIIAPDGVIQYLRCFPIEKYIFPKRTWGSATFLALFSILLVGFAGIYLIDFPCGFDGISLKDEKIYALYISFQTMGLNDFKPVDSTMRMIVMFQLFSAVLFLTALFPLYISRLSNLDTLKIEDTDNGVQQPQPSTTNLRNAVKNAYRKNVTSNENFFTQATKILDAIDVIVDSTKPENAQQKNIVVTDLLNTFPENKDIEIGNEVDSFRNNLKT